MTLTPALKEILTEFGSKAAPHSIHNFNQDSKPDPFSRLSLTSPTLCWFHSLPRYNVDSKTNISKPVSKRPLAG